MRVIENWRYPVTSVPGERLAPATIGPHGIDGDRVCLGGVELDVAVGDDVQDLGPTAATDA
jgi:hypothetical protein